MVTEDKLATLIGKTIDKVGRSLTSEEAEAIRRFVKKMPELYEADLRSRDRRGVENM